jgi:dihydroaeruginoic acid synthetase
VAQIEKCLAVAERPPLISEDSLPEAQRLVRDAVNSTFVPVEEKLLHQDFFIQAGEHPERTALLWDESGQKRGMTYGGLADRALRLAALLIAKGVRSGTVVAVTLPPGPDQVVAVLAVLAAGAAYVPIGVNQPDGRRERICRQGGISHLVTARKLRPVLAVCTDLTVITVDEAKHIAPLPQPLPLDPEALAYVIFTSGSTGEPKGVEITHGAVYNTIFDINNRFAVNESDRILAVSALDFDLSVYDLFGLLSVGGGVVLPDESVRREAPIWLELIRRMKVTIWNSVPALLEMLLTASGAAECLTTLRLTLVSGDWVGLDLYDRLRQKTQNCRFIALGGATEASIWSNYFEVHSIDPSWKSIPYGKPLNNQCFRVVDQMGRDCPDMVTGELWIGGKGVASGYRGNPELTRRSFRNADGVRWYRTGDLGRYRPDGVIEFLGRADQQVKLRGYRIELGEIEAVLRQYAGVSRAVAAMATIGGAPHLVAGVVAESVGEEMEEIRNVFSGSQEAAPAVFRAALREIQAQIVEVWLLEVLDLGGLVENPAQNLNLTQKLQVAEVQQPLLQLWLRWLNDRKVLTVAAGTVQAGPRLREVLQYAETVKPTMKNSHEVIRNEFLSDIGRRLLRRCNDYRAILSCRPAAATLLDDDLLAPECLASRDPGTISGLALLVAQIKQLAQAAGKPLEIALLGGRSGLFALQLLERLDLAELHLTFFETAPSMVAAAKMRLAALPHGVDYVILSDDYVPEQFCYRFDIVLAINTLHRYCDPYQGCAIAILLLRNGGKLFALEHCELTPIALVTAAVLDKGFTELDHERRQAGSPMLPASEWLKLFKKAGFNDVRSTALPDSFTEFLEAVCPVSRRELLAKEILNLAATLLPAYMLPEKIAILPSLPLSANGKVNRQAVSALFESDVIGNDGGKPQEGMEEEVAGIWKKLLNVNSLGRSRDFFKSGGDSLLATRFLAEVKERFGVELSLKELFVTPALFQVAALLDSKLSELERDRGALVEGEI